MARGYILSKIDELELMVDPSHYQGIDCDYKKRFMSHWHQINEVLKLRLEPVFEIGIGNAISSNY